MPALHRAFLASELQACSRELALHARQDGTVRRLNNAGDAFTQLSVDWDQPIELMLAGKDEIEDDACDVLPRVERGGLDMTDPVADPSAARADLQNWDSSLGSPSQPRTALLVRLAALT